MRIKPIFIFCGFLVWWIALPLSFGAQDEPAPQNRIRLVQAVMCESIDAFEPKNISVAFPVDTGRVSCFTSFADLSETVYIEHRWYRRDELITTKRLTLKPPSWSTYSSIQLREADKGPWRVEIRGADDRLIKVLRFSVCD